MGAFREAFIVARLFDGMDVCERIFGQLSVHGKEVENTPSRFSSARSMFCASPRPRRDGTTRTENSRDAYHSSSRFVFLIAFLAIFTHTHARRRCAHKTSTKERFPTRCTLFIHLLLSARSH